MVLPFPFTDLSGRKRRPALVLEQLEGDDVILCQITSKATSDKYAIALRLRDFESGGLKGDSNIRINRLFTADSRIISYRAGTVTRSKLEEVLKGVRTLFGD